MLFARLPMPCARPASQVARDVPGMVPTWGRVRWPPNSALHAIQSVADLASKFGLINTEPQPPKGRVWTTMHSLLHLQKSLLRFSHVHNTEPSFMGPANTSTVLVEFHWHSCVFRGTSRSACRGGLAAMLFNPPPSSRRAPFAKNFPWCKPLRIDSFWARVFVNFC